MWSAHYCALIAEWPGNVVDAVRSYSSVRLCFLGDVAQLVERGLCKPEVVGSIPIVSTIVELRIAAR